MKEILPSGTTETDWLGFLSESHDVPCVCLHSRHAHVCVYVIVSLLYIFLYFMNEIYLVMLYRPLFS